MRPLRAGDYSFNQIGPTGVLHAALEHSRRGAAPPRYYAVGGNGGSPTWHTPNDLPEVASLPILQRDLQVYVTTILRVINAPLYPFDYSAAVDEIAKAVGEYRDAAAGEVDLDPY